MRHGGNARTGRYVVRVAWLYMASISAAQISSAVGRSDGW